MKSLSKRMLHIGLLALGCAWMTSQLALGQTLGSIAGEIRDATGAVVAGANISVTNTGTNATRTAVTNDAGGYVSATRNV